jgi:hypothetical protein
MERKNGMEGTPYEECNRIKIEQSSMKQMMVVSAPGDHAVLFLLYHPRRIAAAVFD